MNILPIRLKKALLPFFFLAALISCEKESSQSDRERTEEETIALRIQELNSTLYVAVYPGVVLRKAPETASQALSSIHFGERVSLDKERLKATPSEQEILGLRGYWLPVTFNEIVGWVFFPLVREANSDDCYISEGGQLSEKSCSQMEQEKMQCLTFDPEKFPENFDGGCTSFGFYQMESPDEIADCGTPYTGVLSPDGGIKRIFQVHDGFNGTWTKEENALLLTIEFWQQSCYEGCRYGNSHEECTERCKDQSPDKWKEKRTYRVTQPQVGLPEVQYEDTTKRICFTQYWVWKP